MSREERIPLHSGRSVSSSASQSRRHQPSAQYGVPRDVDYSQLFNYSIDEEEATSIRIPRSVVYCGLIYAAVVTIALLSCTLALLIHSRESVGTGGGDGGQVTPLPPISDSPYSSGHLPRRSRPSPPPPSTSPSTPNSSPSTASSALSNFLLITDLHLEPHYNATSPQSSDLHVCRDAQHLHSCQRTDWELSSSTSSPSSSPFPYGRYNCDPPDLLLSSSLLSLASTLSSSSTSLAFVLVAGDLAAHFVPCPLTQYHTIDRTVSLITRAFPSTPLVFTLGNTDVFPTNYLPSPSLSPPLSEVTLVNCGPQFRSLLSIFFRHGVIRPSDKEAVRTFCHGGYYTRVLTDGRVRVISLNTNVWSAEYSDAIAMSSSSDPSSFDLRSPWKDNITTQPIALTSPTLSFGFPLSYPSNTYLPTPLSCSSPSRLDDPYNQFRYLHVQIRLASLSDPPQHIHILGHHPPGIKPSASPSASWCPQYQRRFKEVIARWPNVVQGLMFGDYSQNVVRVMGGSAAGAGQVVHIHPGLSPRKNVNPAARVYQFDTNTGRIVDYHQHYVDLNALQLTRLQQHQQGQGEEEEEQEGVVWSWQYSAKDYYGMSEYGAEGWLNVVKRMGSEAELMERYVSGVNVWKVGDGDEVSYACDILAMEMESNTLCRRTGHVPLSSHTHSRKGCGGAGHLAVNGSH